MQVENSQRVPEPVTVDDTFLMALKGVTEEIRQILLERIATEEKIATSTLTTLASGKKPKNIDEYRVDLLTYRLKEAGPPTYSVSFPSGYSFQTTDYDQMIGSLNAEPESPKSIEINVGYYDRLHLSVRLGGLINDVSYSIKGNEHEVHYFSSKMIKIIQNAVVPNKWLHGALPRVIVTISLLIAAFFTYAFMLSFLRPHIGNGVFTALAALWGLPVGAMFFVADYPSARLRTLYPRIPYEYGAEKRRRAARRSLLQWIIGIILIPAIMALLPTVFSHN